MPSVVPASDDDDPLSGPTWTNCLLPAQQDGLDEVLAWMKKMAGLEQFTDVSYEDLGMQELVTLRRRTAIRVTFPMGILRRIQPCLVSFCHSRQAAEQGTGGTGPNADYHLSR